MNKKINDNIPLYIYDYKYMDKKDFEGLKWVSYAEYHAKFSKTLENLENHCKYAIPHFINIINQRMDFQGII